MSVSGEKLNLLIMRDSGETKRFRIRRSYFRASIALFACFPLITIFTVWGNIALWRDNAILSQRIMDAELKSKEHIVKSERLSNLEALLKHEKDIEIRIEENAVSSTLQETSVQSEAPTVESSLKNSSEKNNESQEEVSIDDGPGHVDFPVIDEGVVVIENVQSRLVDLRRVRTSLDLRNPGNEALVGEVDCILSLASGETIPLVLSPVNVGNYKILRWKKAVLFANVPEGHDLFNSQMIVEVKDANEKLVYRNMFPIEQ